MKKKIIYKYYCFYLKLKILSATQLKFYNSIHSVVFDKELDN